MLPLSISRRVTAHENNRVSFQKYSSHGNHFVLVDEIGTAMLDEVSRPAFARRATDPYAGIGADNVIFIQSYSAKALDDIQRAHGYWPAQPAPASAPQVIVRFFEPNGAEFLTCGDALVCVALHLFRHHGLTHVNALVEIPSSAPSTCTLSHCQERGVSTIRLRPDRSRIADFVDRSFDGLWKDDIGFFISGLRIEVAHASPIILSGMLLYTGEPHMVVFQTPNSMPPEAWPAELPWTMVCPDIFSFGGSSLSAASLAAVGSYLNGSLATAFPAGINVNVARPCPAAQTVEYRCFERGLHRETLACGTGAIAVSIAAHRLGLAPGTRLHLLPHHGRQHERYADAEIVVEHQPSEGHYALTSKSEHVFSGTMPMPF